MKQVKLVVLLLLSVFVCFAAALVAQESVIGGLAIIACWYVVIYMAAREIEKEQAGISAR